MGWGVGGWRGLVPWREGGGVSGGGRCGGPPEGGCWFLFLVWGDGLPAAQGGACVPAAPSQVLGGCVQASKRRRGRKGTGRGTAGGMWEGDVRGAH